MAYRQHVESINYWLGQLEEMEKEVHSKAPHLPEEWFWSKKSVQELKKVIDHISKELSEMNEFSIERRLESMKDKISNLVARLRISLYSIERKNYFYTKEEADEINKEAKEVEKAFLELIKESNWMRVSYKDKEYGEKMDTLLKLGLDVTTHKKIADLLIHNWVVIDKMAELFNSDSSLQSLMQFQRYTRYIFACLPIFFEIVSPHEQEGDNEKNSLILAEYLGYSLILITIAIIGTQKGFREKTAKIYLPALANCIKDLDQLKEICSFSEKLHLSAGRISEEAVSDIIVTVFPNFGGLIRKNSKAFVDVFDSLLAKYPKVYWILTAIVLFKDYIKSFNDLLFLGEKILSTQQWISKHGYVKGMLHYRLEKALQDPISFPPTKEGFDRMFEVCKRVEENGVFELLMGKISESNMPFLIKVLMRTHHQVFFLTFLFRLISNDLSQLEIHKRLVFTIGNHINALDKEKEHFSYYAAKLIGLAHIVTSIDELEYLFSFIKKYDHDYLETVFEVLEHLKETRVGSFSSFINHGGKEVIESIKEFKGSASGESIDFCHLFVEKMNPRNAEEIISIFNVCFRFIHSAIRSNRVRAQYLEELSHIPDKFFTYFGDYLLFIMEKAPNDFFIVLRDMRHTNQINKDFSKELFEIARLCRAYRILKNAKAEKTKVPVEFLEKSAEFVKRAYLIIAHKIMIKEKKIESSYYKLDKNLGTFLNAQREGNLSQAEHSLDRIMEILIPLSIIYLEKITEAKVKDAFSEYCGLPLPELEGKIKQEDVVNALLVAKNTFRGYNEEVAREFIRQLCLKNILPFKSYPNNFPYSQDIFKGIYQENPRSFPFRFNPLQEENPNMRFIKQMERKGILMDFWVKGYEGVYDTRFTDAEKNIAKIILDNIREVLAHLKEYVSTNITEIVEEYDVLIKSFNEEKAKQLAQKVSGLYKEVISEGAIKRDSEIAADIKGHISHINSMIGKRMFHAKIKKLKIFIETEPLKTLQMGNVVGGSCLSLGGGNEWTTFTNALDINKRVIFAVDPNNSDIIIGRRIIAMKNDGAIIQLGTYNNSPEIDLDAMFERFTKELAEKCNTSVSDYADTEEGKDVETLIGERWYAGTEVQAPG